MGHCFFGGGCDAPLVLHCCNKARVCSCRYPAMTTRKYSRSGPLYRSLRSRMVALLLLVAQLTALLVVPLHAVAHARTAYASDSVAVASATNTSTRLFSNLFGHEQGSGCDDWSAAFSLDSYPGHAQADLAACLSSATKVSGAPPFASLPPQSRPFLARAPPRI